MFLKGRSEDRESPDIAAQLRFLKQKALTLVKKSVKAAQQNKEIAEEIEESAYRFRKVAAMRIVSRNDEHDDEDFPSELRAQHRKNKLNGID